MAKISNINISQPPANKLGNRLRKRLSLMQQRRQSKFEAALSIAETHSRTNDKAKGKSGELTPYEKGQRLRANLIKAGAIATDESGQVAERITNEVIEAEKTLRRKKKEEELEKYGGRPDLIQHVLEVIGNLDQTTPISRRFLLFGGPKKLANSAGKELAPMLLPWPLNRVASLFKFFT